jgi:hypothetical protein
MRRALLHTYRLGPSSHRSPVVPKFRSQGVPCLDRWPRSSRSLALCSLQVNWAMPRSIDPMTTSSSFAGGLVRFHLQGRLSLVRLVKLWRRQPAAYPMARSALRRLVS